MANILVLEDDPLFRDSVARSLEMQGHVVEGAASAEEAEQKAREQPFDLLVSDIRIAGKVDGVGALERFRSTHPELRCILMTGFADADAPVRAARLQADDYLLKPFKLQALLQSVQAVLERDEQAPAGALRSLDSAQGVSGWLFDPRLQQLEVQREKCIHQFFILARARRLEPCQAYGHFCAWERIELEYLEHHGPRNWERLLGQYQKWESQLSQLQTQNLTSPTLSRGRFDLMFARIQAGVLSVTQLLQSIRLLHSEVARKESLMAYCNYHWLWSDQLDQGDPFLSLTINGYRLMRHRSVLSPQVRLYEAEAEYRPRRGDLVLCLPDAPESSGMMSGELRSERAAMLTTSYGHHFLLYRGFSMSLRSRLPRQGVDAPMAWRILRPVFVQVAAYHKQERCSGCFSLRDIDSPPGQPCSLSQFSPAAYREAHLWMLEAQGDLIEFNAAPEVLYQAEPSPLSDQAVLGRILFEVVFGGHYPDPALRVHIRKLGSVEANCAFGPHIARLAPLQQVFYRLSHAQPSQRFASLEDAIALIDQILRVKG